MTVTSQLSSLEDMETSPTLINIGSGGGPTADANTFIEGAQSGGRRCDVATDKGFMATVSLVDLSGANEHVKMWVLCFQWPIVTGLTIRMRSGTTAGDNHEYGAANIPALGGWFPMWVDVSRTPDSTLTSGLDEAAVVDLGAYIDIGNAPGSGNNFFIDEIMHGTSGYLWDGTGGDFSDFTSYEATNIEGVIVQHLGSFLVLARLEIGSSTATGFSDTGFSILFPDQPLISTTFMGLTFDLQNASTVIDLSNGSFSSDDPVGATNRPDVIAIGTGGGTLDLDNVTFNGFRTFLIGEACNLTNCSVLNSGVIDATSLGTSGADCSGTKVIDSIAASNASALIWDVNSDPDGELDNMTFTRGAATHHAIELGLTSPLSMTVRGHISSGFHADNGENDSYFHVLRTSGNVTISVIGGTGNFSYKSEGANVTIVEDTVTLNVTVNDNISKDALENVIVSAWAVVTDPTGPFDPATVTITRSGSDATVAHIGHGLDSDDEVRITGAAQPEYNGFHVITVTGVNEYTYTVLNTPATPATGDITAGLLLINGLTDSSGAIGSTARTFSADQDFEGEAKKGTSSPVYVTGLISGTIDTATGATANAPLVKDE